MRVRISAVVVCGAIALGTVPARPQAAHEATIQPETKARIVLQSRLSSKLNEPGDSISAVLNEPIYVDGLLVMARGTEFHGRVTAVSPAGRGQKSAQMAIVFDRISMPWGEEPVAVILTAIDDWDKDERLNADSEGKVKGGHRAEKTVDNVLKGGHVGALGASTVILARAGSAGAGTLAAGGATIAGGMLAGLLLTKGSEVRVEPGAVFRIKFVKPLTLPVIQQPGASPRPIQQDEAAKESDSPPKKP